MDKNIGQGLGYSSLTASLKLSLPASFHTSSLGPGGRSRHPTPEGVHETFPAQFWREPTDFVEQLIFALKYDGVDLLVLRAVFERIGNAPLERALRASPTSAYLRRLWFLYEFLLARTLDVPDAAAGPYVDLLEPELYVTRVGPKIRRQRVNFNLLGVDREFCPIVRFTDTLSDYCEARLHERATSAVRAIPPRDLQRAIRYLYVKETRASFEIERAKPTERLERFVEALFSHGVPAGGPLWWGERELLQILALIINDPRFVPDGYRDVQVRVSEQRSLSLNEKVHYVAPRHADVSSFMAAFLRAWRHHHLHELPRPLPGAVVGDDGKPYAVRASCGDPFVDFIMAGCLSFGFVYLHPFIDGNGRLHRLILHRVLAATGFTPPKVVIPISAAILHDQSGYDAALESFSSRVMPFVEYTVDDRTGALSVTNETAWLYRYPDLTVQMEALAGWFKSAIDTELVEELNVLRAVDAAKAAMREVVELPDQREDLFLKLCVQNGREGRAFALSKGKRSLFSELADHEIEDLEAAVAAAFTDVVARDAGS